MDQVATGKTCQKQLKTLNLYMMDYDIPGTCQSALLTLKDNKSVDMKNKSFLLCFEFEFEMFA